MSSRASRAGRWFAVGGLVVLTVPSVGGQTREDLLKKSDLIFVGTVKKVAAASFSDVPVSGRTLVVVVEAVLQKPDAVSLARGDEVTVEAKEGSFFQPGGQATFYTEAWIFGEGLAVREVGHEVAQALAATESAALRAREDDMTRLKRSVADRELKERLASAAVVAVGRVKSVRPASRLREAAGGPPARVSEHDPNWQEAVVHVETGLKGVEANRDIVVRFPGSMDIAWHLAPKFKAGQEGTFILQKDQVRGIAKATLEGVAVESYTALSAEDVLSTQDAERVRALLKP